MIEKIAVASGLRARDGRNVVAKAIYIDVVQPLLATNREAQPVGVMNIGSETCSDYRVAWTKSGTQLGKGVHWLYTTPPAPAVPEEMTGGIAMSKYKVKKSNYVQWVKGFNACRAAMLAQPVSSGYTLPEGFKLVPVEPTEEMLRAAYRESGVYSAKAYRAMLASAPEGGNGA
ncbi:hypothetical protein PTR13_04020 [Serratia bockelmannii]|uniref:hypothetical protein n=1 Tax=Serratia TaxID=613 RepID=UPI0029CD0681|nr:hypothetical protein [Serratia marcescens]